jgi:hypothetical protein
MGLSAKLRICGSLRLNFIKQKLDISINIVSLLYVRHFSHEKNHLTCHFFTAFFLYSQSWQWSKQIGGEGLDLASISYIDAGHNSYIFGRYAYTFVPQFNGWNCYIGEETLHGKNASFIAKYSENGNLVWVKNLVSSGNDANLIVMEYDTASNALFLAGGYATSLALPGCNLSGSGYHSFLAKMDLDGNCLWAKNIGTYLGISAMTIDHSGNVFIAGNTSSGVKMIDTCRFGGGSYIAKFNPSGTVLFAKTIVAIETNINFSIETLKFFDDNIFVNGNVNSNNKPLIIDTINIPISCEWCSGIVVICFDTVAKARWINLDGLPASSISNRSMGMNYKGDIYCYAFTGGTCTFSDDTIVSQGTNSIVVIYNKSGIILGYNHLLFSSGYSGYFNHGGITVNNEGSYYITNNFEGLAKFGNDTVTAISNCDLFLAHFNDNGECLGVDNIGGGLGTSIAVDETGVYMTGILSPFPSDTGSMVIGNNMFSTYGFEDIVFAKHDLMTGTEEIKQATDNSLVIYANPNKGSFRVKIPIDFANEKQLELSIFDMKGKLIGRQSLFVSDGNQEINIHGQPPGTYTIRLSNGQKSHAGKLVVE